MEDSSYRLPDTRKGTNPLLHYLTLSCLFLHLAASAATQTAYGHFFSSMRWASIVMLAFLALADWLAASRRCVNLGFVKRRVGIYLLLWLLPVLMSDYHLFSGLRYAAHAAVLIPLMVLLPERMNSSDFGLTMNVILTICLMVLIASSVLGSPQLNSSPHGWYQGIVGNSNSLGHFSAVGLVIFAHAAFSAKRRVKKFFLGALALLALALLLQSFARSSAIAALAGLSVLFLFYRAQMSKYVMAALVTGAVMLISDVTFSERLAHRIFKHDIADTSAAVAERLLVSRVTVFERSIDGFQERPLFGWGFGVDADTNLTTWSGQFTSTGFAGRDPVNDTLYTLETGGVIGFVAYLLLIALIVQVWRQRQLAKALSIGSTQKQDIVRHYIGFLSLTITLAVLFQFDNTALAAGNFFSVLFWLSLGSALALAMHIRSEALRMGLLCVPIARRINQKL